MKICYENKNKSPPFCLGFIIYLISYISFLVCLIYIPNIVHFYTHKKHLLFTDLYYKIFFWLDYYFSIKSILKVGTCYVHFHTVISSPKRFFICRMKRMNEKIWFYSSSNIHKSMKNVPSNEPIRKLRVPRRIELVLHLIIWMTSTFVNIRKESLNLFIYLCKKYLWNAC